MNGIAVSLGDEDAVAHDDRGGDPFAYPRLPFLREPVGHFVSRGTAPPNIAAVGRPSVFAAMVLPDAAPCRYSRVSGPPFENRREFVVGLDGLV